MNSVEINILELLSSRGGEGKSFVRANLKGKNLQNTRLSGADLTEADLLGADLRGAILTNANLTRAQVIGADFTGATLTGACLENWNLSHTTKLAKVHCQYVYLLNQQRERRPNSGEFADGGFASYFQAPFDSTVDFIFRGSIDWDAFVKAFARLRVQFGEVELRVQGIEDKGDGTFVVKVSVPVNAEKEPIHRSFTRFYVERVALNERGQQSELTSGNDLVQHWKTAKDDFVYNEEGIPKLDVFVSYASENRSFVEPLVARLKATGLKVWYDKDVMTLGDNIADSINAGLLGSRFGVVVLSQEYFQKDWTNRELNALFEKESVKQKVILPIWYGLTKQEVAQCYPLLAGKLALPVDKATEDLEYVATEILRAIQKTPS